MNPTPATALKFVLNGQPVEIPDVSPATLLVDYLRSPEVGLTGTKIGCKQGGCGACTVLLSQYDPATGAVSHRAVNSCMRPLAALDGMMVTTVEGCGSVETAVSPVQYCLAKNNGTQCGYCTPGWVMSAHGCLASRGVTELKFDPQTDRVDPTDPNLARLPTRQELQEHFDGNLCRCTGYRPILQGFEQGFAKDWKKSDAEGCMPCHVDPAEKVNGVSTRITPEFPAALRVPPRPVHFARDGYTWFRPTTLVELGALVREFGSATNLKLVRGNTSIGIYDKYVEDPRVLLDIEHVAELRQSRVTGVGLEVGAAVTYTDFLALLDAQIAVAEKHHRGRLAGLRALRYLAHRTAGTIVRDAASLGGNTMLVVRHIAEGTPFPSDLFTALAAAGASVRVLDDGHEREWPLLEFARRYPESESLRARGVLIGYRIPFTGAGEFAQTYKTALREVNAHSILNAGFRVRFDAAGRVADAAVVFGGVAPVAVRLPGVEAALTGRTWDGALLAAAQAALAPALDELFLRYRARYAALAYEGFTDDYRRTLAASFVYKFFVEVALAVNPAIIPETEKSAGHRAVRPVSRGTQHFRDYAKIEHTRPLGVPYVKIEAFLQATGEAVYPQDVPLPHRGLEAAFAVSTRARAKFHYVVPGGDGPATPAQVLACLQARFPGVADYLTQADLRSGQNLQGQAKDQPVFAALAPGSTTTYAVATGGQSLGLVLAADAQVALDAAHYVGTQLVAYTDTGTPVVAINPPPKANNLFPDNPSPGNPAVDWITHVWQVIRPGSVYQWFLPPAPSVELGGVQCAVVRGSQDVGGQVHFYMETQTCVVIPGEEGQLVVRSSTQDSAQVQMGIASALGLPTNKVDVRIKRIGGGYGGKCSNPTFVAVAAAVAAQKHGRAVRLAVKREVDTAMFGHRHPGHCDFTIAVGDGSDRPENFGRIMGLQNDFLLNGGWTYDCSFTVMDCLQLRVDSAYFVPNYGTSGDVCQTNIASNTAFRTMGLIQGIIMQEEAIEAAAHRLGVRPEKIRELNLYRPGQSTPYGQKLRDCYIRRVFETTRAKYHFDARLAKVEEFNRRNRWRKRGISLIPVKYGSGFNLPALEQAGALVEIFDNDGTVLVRTGGIEMGQGLNTKIAQVAAYYLGIPLTLIRVAELDTAVVPHPTSTGASTGSTFNADAVRACCVDLHTRLKEYCRIKQLPFPMDPQRRWDPSDPKHTNANWKKAVSSAHGDCINLSSQQRVAIQGGEQVASDGLFFHDAPPPDSKATAK
ncbi:MAG: Xanthine dehydrogenase molybdenum-binding subunit, partial [Verrucomicrobiota bacterium]